MPRLTKTADDHWVIDDYKINQQNRLHLDKDGLIKTYYLIKEELKNIGYLY